MGGVPPARRRRLAASREPLEAVRGNRVEQPVADAPRRRGAAPATGRPAGPAGRTTASAATCTSRPRLRRADRSAARRVQPSADGQPAQQDALGLGEQRLAPVDRGAQRLLPRRSAVRLPAGQQPEPVVQPRRPARAAESARTRAAASSIASGMPSSRRQTSATAARVVVVEGESRAARRPPGRRTAAPPRAVARSVGGRRARRRAPSGGTRQARLAGDAPAARGWWPGSAAAGQAPQQRVGQLGAGVDQVLAVVEHQQQLPGSRAAASVGQRARPALSRRPSAAAVRSATSASPAPRPARPARRRPRTGRRAAASSASRVLPTPPGPVRVSSRDDASRLRTVVTASDPPVKTGERTGQVRPRYGLGAGRRRAARIATRYGWCSVSSRLGSRCSCRRAASAASRRRGPRAAVPRGRAPSGVAWRRSRHGRRRRGRRVPATRVCSPERQPRLGEPSSAASRSARGGRPRPDEWLVAKSAYAPPRHRPRAPSAGRPRPGDRDRRAGFGNWNWPASTTSPAARAGTRDGCNRWWSRPSVGGPADPAQRPDLGLERAGGSPGVRHPGGP